MDEPCSALDPISTARVEDLMDDLKNDYTIVIVTHNMQQARRVSDMTACLMLDETATEDGHRTGIIAEFSPTDLPLHQPQGPADRGLHHRPDRLSRRDRVYSCPDDVGPIPRGSKIAGVRWSARAASRASSFAQAAQQPALTPSRVSGHQTRSAVAWKVACHRFGQLPPPIAFPRDEPDPAPSSFAG